MPKRLSSALRSSSSPQRRTTRSLYRSLSRSPASPASTTLASGAPLFAFKVSVISAPPSGRRLASDAETDAWRSCPIRPALFQELVAQLQAPQPLVVLRTYLVIHHVLKVSQTVPPAPQLTGHNTHTAMLDSLSAGALLEAASKRPTRFRTAHRAALRHSLGPLVCGHAIRDQRTAGGAGGVRG